MIRELSTHLLQSTGFAIVAGLMSLAFRHNRAKVRYALWLSASLKFLLPFSLLMSLGGHLGWAPAPRNIALPAVSFVIEHIAEPFAEPLPPAPSAQVAASWTAPALFGVWICGFAAILLMRVRSWLRIRTAIRSSTTLTIPAAVEIRTSPSLLEPGVVGLVRPLLLLPEGILDRLTPPQLEAVLAHELCHVRRRDNLLAAVHMVVEAVYWFHPLVWWIGARLVEERERACDEAVLTLGSEPRTYADAILNVCKHYVQSPLVCVSGVTGADLKRRIEAILTNRTGQSLNRAKKLLLACAGVAALAGPVAIGVVISIGHVPAVRAESPQAVPQITQTAQAIPAVHRDSPAPAAAEPQAPVPTPNRRLLAMLFDSDTTSSEDQARVRQAAIRFIHTNLRPEDIVSVLSAENGTVKVVRDFTNDPIALDSAITAATAVASAAPVDGPRPSIIETAAQLLSALPEKKGLLYFSTGTQRAFEQAELQRAIEALQKANVAIYSIDVRGAVPQIVAPSAPIARQPLPDNVSDEEYNRRLEYARVTFGSTGSPMSRTYIQHGAPDSIDERGPNGPNASQIWRYAYLENFRSNVEYEFTPGNRASGVRINWPAPSGTYEGVAGIAAGVAEPLAREVRDGGDSSATTAITGLPGRHASIQTYPAGEWQTLVVPLDALSGRLDLAGHIKTRSQIASQNVAGIRDNIDAATGTARVNFLLMTGSYSCTVLLRERATGRMYGETIEFEVK